MGAVAKYVSDIYRSLSTALVGMSVTGREAFKKPVTLEYPDVRWQLPERYRGILHNRQEDCIGCLACARACPVKCIHIEIVKREKDEYGTTSDGTKITQWIPQFDIDMSLCMLCGLCTEPCPTECLTMTKEYELSVHDKRDMYLEFALERDKEIVARKAEEKKRAEAEAAAVAAAAPAAPAPAPAAPATATPPTATPATAAPPTSPPAAKAPEAPAKPAAPAPSAGGSTAE